MGVTGFCCPSRLVASYILPEIETQLLGRFHPDSFKTERLVCVEAERRTDERTWIDRFV